MPGMHKVWNTIRPALHILFLILTALILICVLLSAFLKFNVLKKDNYLVVANKKETVNSMTTYLYETLESECLFYDIPFEQIKSALPVETVSKLMVSCVDRIYTMAVEGGKPESIIIDTTLFQQVLEAYFYSLPDEEQPRNLQETAITISTELAEKVELRLNAGIDDTVLTGLHSFLFSNGVAYKLASNFWLFLVLLLLACAISFLLGTGDIFRRFYTVFGTLLIGSMAVFTPLFLLCEYDLLSRIVIGDSPLKLYINNLYNMVLGNCFSVSLFVFVILGLLTIIAIVAIVIRQSRKITTD